MKTKMSLQAVDSVLDSKLDVNGVNLVTTKFEGMDMNTLKEVADNLRDKLVSGVVVLANTTDDKLNLVATATKDAVDKGVHCGNIVKSIAQIAGGKGGGAEAHQRPLPHSGAAADPGHCEFSGSHGQRGQGADVLGGLLSRRGGQSAIQV